MGGDLEGNMGGEIELLSLHLLGGTEESHETTIEKKLLF
jgi:hypothetical protein